MYFNVFQFYSSCLKDELHFVAQVEQAYFETYYLDYTILKTSSLNMNKTSCNVSFEGVVVIVMLELLLTDEASFVEVVAGAAFAAVAEARANLFCSNSNSFCLIRLSAYSFATSSFQPSPLRLAAISSSELLIMLFTFTANITRRWVFAQSVIVIVNKKKRLFLDLVTTSNQNKQINK
ncbi:hypothetical protein FF38_10951 [Lucilia cuprina]|uniref:Uncharacterized protein n=1 Tax=Lucilia cuprina TaxID=7375 RepID=A0A0L0C3N5_LUCCU|nr:hypothetical protein FF38_10951 [Lucilia cuprina]